MEDGGDIHEYYRVFLFPLIDTSDILPPLITVFKIYFWKIELLGTGFNIDKNSANSVRFSLKHQYKFVSTLEMQR